MKKLMIALMTLGMFAAQSHLLATDSLIAERADEKAQIKEIIQENLVTVTDTHLKTRIQHVLEGQKDHSLVGDLQKKQHNTMGALIEAYTAKN